MIDQVLLHRALSSEEFASVSPASQSRDREAFVGCQVLLTGIVASDWRLVKPVLLTIEQDDDGWYIVSEDEFLVYGTGRTPVDAIEDYKHSLIEYRHLVAAGSPGSPYDQAELARLDGYLQHVPSARMGYAAQTWRNTKSSAEQVRLFV